MLKSPSTAPPLTNPVVLIVEDHPIIRMGAVDLVQAAGCEAVEAQDADAAIAVLRSRSDIRVVFTDVQMPGSMDGLKLAHYISERWPPIRLIVASGERIVAESQLPTGARFFAKPYDVASIVDLIKVIVAETDAAGAPAG